MNTKRFKNSDAILQKIIKKTCSNIYERIYFVAVVLNVDLKQIIVDCKNDFNQFYEIISMYYDDYHSGGVN